MPDGSDDSIHGRSFEDDIPRSVPLPPPLQLSSVLGGSAITASDANQTTSLTTSFTASRVAPGAGSVTISSETRSSVASTLPTTALPTPFFHPNSSTSSSQTTASIPLTESAAAAAATSTTALVTMDDADKVRNGLIAGIVVLGVLFLAMTAALIWTLRGKRGKNSTHKRQYTISAPRSPVITKGLLDPSLAGLESTIAILETQLHEKDTQLREQQVSTIAKGQPPAQTLMTNRASMPDNHMQERFITLQAAVSKWVHTHFGTAKFTATPIPDAIAVLKKTFPQYANLLKGNTSVSVILEGLVLDMISHSISSGQLLGNEAFWELKQAISSTVSATEANEWRAMTIRLLERTTNYHSDRKEAVEDLSQTIDAACSELTKTRPKAERRESLEQIVDLAAGLTLDMAKQRTMFRIERPQVSVFNPDVMEALDGDEKAVPGAPIQAVVFPALTKSSGEAATGSVMDSGLVIVKAKVLL